MRGNAWLTDSELFAPYDGITRFRCKGSSDRSDLSAQWLPRFRFRIGLAQATSTRERAPVNGTRGERQRDDCRRCYFFCAVPAADSALTLVWKIASQLPFSIFQTDPA